MLTSDQNLRMGFLALQLGFITQADLIAAISHWNHNQDQLLIELLREMEALDEATGQVLCELMQQPTTSHGAWSLKQYLSVLPDSLPLEQALCELDDIYLHETIALQDDFSTLGPTSNPATATETAPSKERFHVLHKHAQGGLGEVWIAEDVQLKRQVALKEI